MNDKELIQALGGPTTVAKKLGLEGKKGVCRVANWMRRGIPAQVKLDHLGIFIQPLSRDRGTRSEKSAD